MVRWSAAVHLNIIQKFGLYLLENTLRLRYKDGLVNAVRGRDRSLLRKSYEPHKYTLLTKWRGSLMLKRAVHREITVF
jgi:hypothetical protein